MVIFVEARSFFEMTEYVSQILSGRSLPSHPLCRYFANFFSLTMLKSTAFTASLMPINKLFHASP
ncbi:hypothetical protein AX13_15105 [Comamonas aquatica DA1877]|uniref:Uncharacterized protein n=1 Tax=Comamonas aquatica DA1877 TaxID=1457173 RepID=A0A014MFT7_9BURK|nr:hypothetical protein AX13_15105 [Comamonas aquatica DA1877]